MNGSLFRSTVSRFTSRAAYFSSSSLRLTFDVSHITFFLMLALVLCACGGTPPPPTIAPSPGTPESATVEPQATITTTAHHLTPTPTRANTGALKIAILLTSVDSPRQELFEQLLNQGTKGVTGTVEIQGADNDTATQRAQVQAALDAGAPLLVIQPVDADAAAAYVDAAHKAGARVISFDRLINSRDLDAYVSHDLAQIGRLQAQAALDWLTAGNVKKPWNFVLLEGGAGDPISAQITRGYHDVLDAQIAKKVVTLAADRTATDPTGAQTATAEELTKAKNNIQAILANNSALARGALAALNAPKLSGKVFVAGAGVDRANYPLLCSGAQNLDLKLDDAELARTAARLAVALSNDRTPADVNFPGGTIRIDDRDVFQVAIPVRAVTSNTIQAALVQTGIVRSAELGACYAPLPAGAPVPRVTGRGSLTLWVQEAASGPIYAYLANLAGAFMAANPGVEIKLLPQDAKTVRDTFADAGEGVDMLWTTNEEIQQFAASDLLRATDFISPTNYAEPAIAGATRDGALYGVPVATGNNLVLYYNKKLLKTAPQDTDALIKLGATLTKESLGQYALVYDTTDPFWLMPWLGGFKGSIVADNRKTPTLDTRAMTETLTLLKTFKDKKVVSPDADNTIADAIFTEGRAGMIINGDEALDTYLAKFGGDLGVTRLPLVTKNDNPRPLTGSIYFALPAGIAGDKLQLAQAFIQFVVSKPIQLDMAKKFHRLPALNDALKDPSLTGDAILKGMADQMLLGIAPPDSNVLTCIWDAIHANQTSAVNGTTPAVDAAHAMQSSAAACVNKLP